MENLVHDVASAQATLAKAVEAARAGGYRVSFQASGGDPFPVVDGGPEPVTEVVVKDGVVKAEVEADHL